MKIGFLANEINERGTANALFNYAYYNKTLLNNDSVIYTLRGGAHEEGALRYFSYVFGGINLVDDVQTDLQGIDALYHIKSGAPDNIWPPLPYLVHAVFEPKPHGDRYAMVSEWLGRKNGLPWVPHIVTLPDVKEDIRQALNIPEDATVFGRHGGKDTFDIPWAWSAINRALKERDDIYFLFMNTDGPLMTFHDGKRVIFADSTINPGYKRMFINACDAMIHARFRGETFGLAVGEFAICGKPVITYEDSPELAHIHELTIFGDGYYAYRDEESLLHWLLHFERGEERFGYRHFTPELVMPEFKEVFLDGLT